MPADRAARRASRRLFVEPLETRTLLATLPFGAMPDDTAEYMLGDVQVTVVLFESNNTIDNGTITYPDPDPAPGDQTITYTYPPENWTTDAINTVKAKVTEGLTWWKDTLDALPTVRDGLLNFTIDWTYADTPVATGYEPIARISNDFTLWMYDFLNKVGFNQTGNFSTDIRAFNNSQRLKYDKDWAFTIFVVNDTADVDKFFTQRILTDGSSFGSFGRAFSFAGGRFMIVPAARPASTFSHESGHIFWAFDEYAGSSASYLSRRGYYNTQNWNHELNPTPGFVQANSIMANDKFPPAPNPPILTLTNAYTSHTSSQSSLETVGWRDGDGDGIFDVLDVPFKLTGIGRYISSTGLYRFTGSASVGTLPNQNTSGLQNDITINQLKVVEVKIDNGAWTTVLTLPPRTYQTALDLSFAVPAGQHTVKLRVSDTRTGVSSAEFSGDTTTPSSTATPGIGGFVFRDDDADGVWDPNEPPLVDFGLDIVDQNDTPIELLQNVEPSLYAESTTLNNINPQATISAIGGDVVAANEVQRLTLTGPAGSTVTPAFGGVNGTPLTVQFGLSPSAGDVLASLNAIPALNGKVSVTGATGGPFQVTFTGSLGQTNVPFITQGAAAGGAALAVESVVEGAPAQVIGRTSALYASQAGKVFTTRSVAQGLLVEKWGGTRQLKVSFQNPVGVVKIRAFSGAGTSFARMEAYNSQGALLERFTTDGISGIAFRELAIFRGSSDIAYVVVSGHAGTEVVLDTLQWGPATSATSNTLGAYSLAFLPAGTYRVKADPPANHFVTTPVGGVATVTVASGQAVGQVNFGIRIQAGLWHNLNAPLNVNNDAQGLVTPIDALLVINWLNSHPNVPELPTSGTPGIDGYVDVNNDGMCTPLDALLVINQLNAGSGGGGEGEAGGSRPAGNESGGEGEEPAAAPQNAAEYYAKKPIHFLQIAGTDLPCTCEECVAQRAAAPAAAPATVEVSLVDALATPPASSTPTTRGRTPRPLDAAGQQLRAGQLLSAARKAASPLAARKQKLEQTLDAIAADVSQVAPPAAARLAHRRGRLRG